MINTKKAFTLVELIVVITILAILGTIAFISLQGYSADARNSKRTQDLNNLAGSINIKTTEGVQLSSFVTGTGNSLSGVSIAGKTPTTSEYSAGEPNYTALGIKAADFKDPNGNYYPLGVTTLKEGQFELASIYENGNGGKTAKVNGTFKSRTNIVGTGAITSGKTSVTITTDDIGKFFKGDTVNIGGTTNNIITKVSSDYKILTLTTAPSATSTATGITLANNESAGMIKGVTTTGGATAVTKDGTELPY